MCTCLTTCLICELPRMVCVESGLGLLDAPEVPSGQITDDGHVIVEPYRRADSVAGMTVHNPLGTEPWTLDVLSAHPAPGEPLAVILHALQGDVRVSRDYPTLPRDRTDDNFEANVMLSVAAHEFGERWGDSIAPEGPGRPW